jgi:hypothetical protein
LPAVDPSSDDKHQELHVVRHVLSIGANAPAMSRLHPMARRAVNVANWRAFLIVDVFGTGREIDALPDEDFKTSGPAHPRVWHVYCIVHLALWRVAAPQARG